MKTKKILIDMARIDHIAIVVDNASEAALWYQKKFGGEIEYLDESWSLLSFENVKLAFVLKTQHPPHFAFEDKSLTIGNEHRDGSISIYEEDPWGNVIELVNYRREDD